MKGYLKMTIVQNSLNSNYAFKVKYKLDTAANQEQILKYIVYFKVQHKPF